MSMHVLTGPTGAALVIRGLLVSVDELAPIQTKKQPTM